MNKKTKEIISDEFLIEKFKNTLKYFWEKDVDTSTSDIQSICEEIEKFNNISILDYKTFGTLKLGILKKLDELFLEKLLFLWIDKYKKLTDNKIEIKEKKYIFNELTDLCSEIYSCLINIICEIFPSSTKIEKVEVSSDVLSISNIFLIFEAFKQEQDFAFLIKKFKRDNIIHQFRVFLLGIYFLFQTKFWINLIWEDLKSFCSKRKFQQQLEKLEKDKNKLIWGIWGLAALFHDCGRVIQTFYESLYGIQSHFEKPLSIFNFSLPRLDTEVNLNLFWKQKKENFFKLLEYFLNVPGSKWYGYFPKIKNILETSLQKPKHGIISALLIIYSNIEDLIKKLKLDKLDELTIVEDFEPNFLKSTLTEMKILKESKSSVNIEDIFPIFLVIYSALAIALHDQEEYWFVTALSTFLILCDNLQEWGRLTKIGDQVTMIFPCDSISILITEKRKKEISIKVDVTYYPLSLSSIEKEVFSRFNPENRWSEFKEKIEQYKNTEENIKMFNELTKDRGNLKIKITIRWKKGRKRGRKKEEVFIEW